jgi:hypothetical protein
MNREKFVDVREAEALSMRMRPFLAGKSPAVQSAVLADLLSIWLAGIRPDLREEFFQGHIALVRDLVPESEKEFFGAGGWRPHGNWPETRQ